MERSPEQIYRALAVVEGVCSPHLHAVCENLVMLGWGRQSRMSPIGSLLQNEVKFMLELLEATARALVLNHDEEKSTSFGLLF